MESNPSRNQRYAIDVAFSEAHSKLLRALEKLGAGAEGKIEITRPKESGRGLLSSPVCFIAGKKAGLNPVQLSQDAVQGINSQPTSGGELLSGASALGGYINFFANDRFHALAVGQAASMGEKYGRRDDGSGRKVVIEYSQPNIGKPFHAGHIRSTILGDAMARLLEANGFEVVRMNYIGDAGTQVAKLVVALEEFKDLPEMRDEKDMLAYYVKIHREIEGNEELAKKVADTVALIESGDGSVAKLVATVRGKSYEAFERNYALLGVHFDEVVGESKFIQAAKEAALEIERSGKKIAFRDEKTGALVADLEKYGIPNTILLRSNGTTLYLTRDIALADYKFGKYKFDRSIVTTASDQNTHFRQVIKILGLLGRPYAQDYGQIGFGLVALPEGKMSTREGRVAFMEDVLNDAMKAAREQLDMVAGQRMHSNAGIKTSRNIEEILKHKARITDDERALISRIVGIGGTKFAFLRIGAEKGITFNPSAAVSFQGDTGAYVQYTCVRAKNILRKAEEKGATGIVGKTDGGKGRDEVDSIGDDLSKNKPSMREKKFVPEEKALAEAIAFFPEVIRSAAIGPHPHAVCEYALRTAALFSEFYELVPVLNAENEGEREKRIMLVKAAKNCLQNSLAILGIQVPERM
ncbi:arginine--tRNA ligase [Candidatus Micrarchaeota archaeon]|nr:arginine--tRNA ligase [Candidatus Micrarchaeota archaeon]